MVPGRAACLASDFDFVPAIKQHRQKRRPPHAEVLFVDCTVIRAFGQVVERHIVKICNLDQRVERNVVLAEFQFAVIRLVDSQQGRYVHLASGLALPQFFDAF